MTMRIPRRFLPPISLLIAFEAAARLQSISAAGRELDLTQSAVSRQIRALEDMLGADLFLRERQTIRLTEAGKAYAVAVREALSRIGNATLNFRANPSGGTLNLAILPTFGSRWLAPRLPQFLAENPGITVNLSTRMAPFDFRLETLDPPVVRIGLLGRHRSEREAGVVDQQVDVAKSGRKRFQCRARCIRVADIKCGAMEHSLRQTPLYGLEAVAAPPGPHHFPSFGDETTDGRGTNA